ncbi:MAG: methyl-accepting chemotaxis protein [Sporomusaceae bacterium]|nr:methyl-accepting chemotaxis protein [Sporomusaceae bacterium]
MTTRRYPIIVQLAAIFATTILLFLSILGYMLYSYANTTTATVEYSDKVNTASSRLIMVKNAHTDFTRALLSMRGFLFYADGAAQYEQEYRSNFANSYETVKSYNLTAQSSDDAGRLERLLAEYLVLGDKVIAAKKNNEPGLNALLGSGRQLVDQIDGQFIVVAEKQGDAINADSEFLIDQSKRQSQLGMTASLAVTIVIIGIVFGYSRRMTVRLNNLKTEVAAVGMLDLTRQDFHATCNDEIGDMAEVIISMKRALRGVVGNLKDSAATVAAASEELTANSEQSAQATKQIAASITSVAAGASEQLAAASETTTIVGQMSSGIQQVSVSTNQVAEQAVRASEKAHDGGKAVEAAVAKIIQVEGTVNASAQVVTKLGERSKEIGQIVDTIAGIAGQTNLLALNAAIEAARAGEQGRGFAVVAEEVRKLAEQSQEAAKKIAELIEEIQGDTEQAVVAMNDGTREVKAGAEVVSAAGLAFREIVAMVSLVSTQMNESSSAIQQIADESQRIVGAVKTIDNLSQMSSGESQSVSAAVEEQLASIEEIATSSEALSKLAQAVQAEVAKFHVEND